MSNTSNVERLNGRNKWLVFTDLDGTLLDHHSYSFSAAEDQLNRLNQLEIPLICCTSKTFAEVIALRKQLKNRHPFIVENGAAVYLPLAFLPERAIQAIGGAQLHEGFWRFGLTESRAHWLTCLDQLGDRFKGLYSTFTALGSQGIANATGLSLDQAALANQREFSEPLVWLGDELSKIAFTQEMNQLGASILEGGRFLHIVGNSNKGKAMLWLQQIFTSKTRHAFRTIAAGDGKNDVPMLELADYALVIKSPTNPRLQLTRTERIIYSEHTGPKGWASGIKTILSM
ncbi:HAD-IIB family hydrolase [Simiduia curdlanivorans]|uniref:HAD-IIB family hydrolase n=1 Tax=Simiduia curdlanivorans TaxID=1492769 RepID=A0ABV8V4Q4_9GAMM|nr:HAD-IIB family hydrolase [Simiduia curdlanivorans]MDN3640532.1 HAD-IIB family hydrolase [Simiduia curdlanivorans]